MIPLAFAAFIGVSAIVALADWRRGWMLAIVCGVLQDPARKLTAGTPVVMTLSVIVVYFVVILSSQQTLQRSFRDFSRRFSGVYGAFTLFAFFLVLAAVNGVATYGIGLWKVPALSLFIYAAPLPAIILGYAYAQTEKQILSLMTFYALVTSVALIGTPLEFFQFPWRALGLVNLPGGTIRFLPGLQIRLLSGLYRAPDIMGWHAAMLAIIGITMAVRARALRTGWPWMLVAGWGFLNCVLSGRRKALYMVVAFVVVFVWRYFVRLNITQMVSFGVIALLMLIVVNHLKSKEESSVYALGAGTTGNEILERLQGGVFLTVDQFGFMGAGLGTATQGVRHLLGHDENIGWQEGGLGKLTIELGVPGLLAVLLLFFSLLRVLLFVTRQPDEEGSTQLLRCALFAIFIANVANFMISAQAYSDAGLTLLTCFFLGCLLATVTLNERLRLSEADAATSSPVRLTRTATA